VQGEARILLAHSSGAIVWHDPEWISTQFRRKRVHLRQRRYESCYVCILFIDDVTRFFTSHFETRLHDEQGAIGSVIRRHREEEAGERIGRPI
jgi:hypothetical protein